MHAKLRQLGHHDEVTRFTVLSESLSGTPQNNAAVASQPAAATAPPSNAGDSSVQLNQSAPGVLAKPLPLPDGRLASREAPSRTGGVSEIVVYPDAAASAHADRKPRTPASVSVMNSRCRAIPLKIEIGEEPSGRRAQLPARRVPAWLTAIAISAAALWLCRLPEHLSDATPQAAPQQGAAGSTAPLMSPQEGVPALATALVTKPSCRHRRHRASIRS